MSISGFRSSGVSTVGSRMIDAERSRSGAGVAVEGEGCPLTGRGGEVYSM